MAVKLIQYPNISAEIVEDRSYEIRNIKMKNTTPKPKVKKHVADKVVSKRTKTSTDKIR